MQTLRLDLQKLYLQDKRDAAAVEKQIRAIQGKQAEFQKDFLKATGQAKELLTPEQVKKLETYGFGPRAGRGGYGPPAGMMGPRWGMGYGR